jgi:hypothetical protein
MIDAHRQFRINGGHVMIRGMHAMFYSSEAAELRTFLRDKLRFKATDVGDSVGHTCG